jgi:hypothetical protein
MQSRNKLLEQILSLLSGGAGGVISVTGGTVDNTDPINPVVNAVESVTGVHVDNTDPLNPIVEDVLHFGAFTVDTIPISDDPDDPTYLTGISLFASSSSEFSIIVAPDGSQLIRNDSTRTFSMQGTGTYQIVQGTGGGTEFFLWSESTLDDGVSFVENTFSLRTSDVPNNRRGSQTKSAAVGDWLPGQAIRWAMYKGAGGDVTLAAPETTVNSGNPVSGFTFFWQLNEV